MEDKVIKGLLDAEKLVMKIKKKVKRNDLDYTIQAVLDSTTPGVVRYAVRVTPINEATGPMIFVANSIKGLQEKLKYRLDNGLEQDEIDLNYHESMLVNLKKTFEYHESKVDEIKNKKEETEE